MYTSKLWDEDKWNIHSSSYSSQKYGSAISEKKESSEYHHKSYGLKDSNSDYFRKQNEDNLSKKQKEQTEESEEETAQDIKEEDIHFRAARQIFNKESIPQKNSTKREFYSIEDAVKQAISKAIKEEKELIVVQ